MPITINTTREKLLAIITAIIAFGAIIFAVIIEPQLDKRKTRLARMHQLQLKLTKMRGDLLIKDRIDKIYLQIEPLITSRGSDQQEISAFTRELRDMYLRLNVNVKTINILPTVNEEYYRRLSVKIEMQGYIRDILKFIFSVEKSPKPVRIERFDLISRETVDNVQMTFVLSKVVSKSEI